MMDTNTWIILLISTNKRTRASNWKMFGFPLVNHDKRISLIPSSCSHEDISVFFYIITIPEKRTRI